MSVEEQITWTLIIAFLWACLVFYGLTVAGPDFVRWLRSGKDGGDE